MYLPPIGQKTQLRVDLQYDQVTSTRHESAILGPIVSQLTGVVFAIKMGSVASVHPPTGSVLLSTVAFEPVVVTVEGAELHAVVGCERFVAGVASKVITVECIPSVAAKVKPVCEAVLVGLRSNSEHVVVGISAGHRGDSRF